MRFFSYIIAILLILFGLSFAILNASPVKLNYYLGTTTIALSLLLVLTVGVGILIGFIVSLGKFFKLKRKIHHLRHRVRDLEAEILSVKVTKDGSLQLHD